jgi:uncharacterized membrane protein YbaN (DUF454 family)
MDLNAKTAALVLGIVFLAVGILGFFPNPLVSPTGLFVVNTAHNIIHLVAAPCCWRAPILRLAPRWR